LVSAHCRAPFPLSYLFLRRAYIEAFPEPVRYGAHGGIKKFYGVEPEEELPTTLDHMIAAVAG